MSAVAVYEVFGGTFNDYLEARAKYIYGAAFTDFIFDDMEMTVFVCSKKHGDIIKDALKALNNIGAKEGEEKTLINLNPCGLVEVKEEDELPSHKHLAQDEEGS